MNSSKLSFLVDVGVGKGIEKYLREDGYDTKAVRKITSLGCSWERPFNLKFYQTN